MFPFHKWLLCVASMGAFSLLASLSNNLYKFPNPTFLSAEKIQPQRETLFVREKKIENKLLYYVFTVSSSHSKQVHVYVNGCLLLNIFLEGFVHLNTCIGTWARTNAKWIFICSKQKQHEKKKLMEMKKCLDVKSCSHCSADKKMTKIECIHVIVKLFFDKLSLFQSTNNC